LPFSLVTPTAVVASPPARSVKETRSGLKRKTWRMLPPGSPPSVLFAGSMERQSYVGPPAATTASISFCTVWSAATVPSFVAPLLSWISSRDTMSGDWRLCTIAAACSAKVLSDGSRFSTLYVATASSPFFCFSVVSRATPALFSVPIVFATRV
jgi:hypothetical protein